MPLFDTHKISSKYSALKLVASCMVLNGLINGFLTHTHTHHYPRPHSRPEQFYSATTTLVHTNQHTGKARPTTQDFLEPARAGTHVYYTHYATSHRAVARYSCHSYPWGVTVSANGTRYE